MIGNISRFPRSPHKGYRQVLLQQGRVLLDADFNEQGNLAAYALRRLTQDLLGRHAGPADELGFAIGQTADGFTIARGRYYVRGLLAANEPPATDPYAGPLAYSDQEGERRGRASRARSRTSSTSTSGSASVSWLEDDTIREVALGGPDTSVPAPGRLAGARHPASARRSPVQRRGEGLEMAEREGRAPSGLEPGERGPAAAHAGLRRSGGRSGRNAVRRRSARRLPRASRTSSTASRSTTSRRGR